MKLYVSRAARGTEKSKRGLIYIAKSERKLEGPERMANEDCNISRGQKKIKK